MTTATQRELTLTRIFDAPRELVFKAWLDARHIAHWWGPQGSTNTVTAWDARPGGAIHLVMEGHGQTHPMGGVFDEVVAPERLVFTATAFDGELENLNTVTFEDYQGRTRLTLHVTVKKASPAISTALDGMEEGWSQSLDRLDDDVVSQTEREITAHRLFQAPRELVWKAWTDPERIIHWWGPKGFTNTTRSMDVQPGGRWEHTMHGPDGTDFENTVRYTEIVKPELIVYTNESSPPFEVTVTFAEQVGKTRLTMRMRFESADVRNKTAEQYGAVEGQSQTLGRLQEYLARP